MRSGSSINYGDRDVGCFLQFSEVLMADLTGSAASWDTCTVGAIGLRQIAVSSKVCLLWDYTQRF